MVYLALYEQHIASYFDVSEATWTSVVGVSIIGADDSASNRSDLAAMEREIDVRGRKNAELRGPRAPPFMLAAVRHKGT